MKTKILTIGTITLLTLFNSCKKDELPLLVESKVVINYIPSNTSRVFISEASQGVNRDNIIIKEIKNYKLPLTITTSKPDSIRVYIETMNQSSILKSNVIYTTKECEILDSSDISYTRSTHNLIVE